MSDHQERGTITGQDLARRAFAARRLRKEELAADALVHQLGFVAFPVACLGQTSCDIHVPPALAIKVASQANSLGCEVIYWHRGFAETPTGRLTLSWPDEPYDGGPRNRPPPPAGPFYGQSEGGRAFWDALRDTFGLRKRPV
ncbi:hypothetical protein [Deinococcus marmoris]|uniref:Uncharacterized protein n=1 Tax=Deinococcus marmoris TaxID=249408 RepID=A0A1U7P4T7_9DEIO|nr:hypothetical protein [Deinococcus marmoris]OLV20182.1 hypothetical protein BOO71_0000574 [Deinococcus marmoris]